MVSAAEQLASNINLSSIAQAEDLKKRIWFTLVALIVYRIGTYIPIPMIDFSQCIDVRIPLIQQIKNRMVQLYNTSAFPICSISVIYRQKKLEKVHNERQ